MKSIDLTSVFVKYKGLWVAFTSEYVVLSADKNAKKAYDTAREKGYTTPRLFKMPQELMPFVGKN